jgi:hypothetical protein
MALANFNYDNWSGGLNLQDSAHGISENELVRAQDVIITEEGRISRRGPFGAREIYNLINARDIIAAGRHQWKIDTQGLLFLATTASETIIYFLPPGETPFTVYRYPGVAKTGSITSGWTRPRGDQYNQNSKLDASIVSCDLFTMVFQYDPDGYPTSLKTRKGQIRAKRNNSNLYNTQLTYVRGKHPIIGNSNWRTSDGKTLKTATAMGPIFKHDKEHHKSGFKYVVSNSLFTFGANTGYFPQHFFWSGDRENLEGGQDSHRWNPDDFEHIIEGENDHITSMQEFNGDIAIFKQHSINIIKAAPDPSDFQRFKRGTIGTIDDRSVKLYKGSLIFADTNGIYRFNGQETMSISEDKIGDRWREYLSAWNPDWTVCAAVVNDRYIISVLNQWGGLVGGNSFVCHLPTGTWGTFGNLPIIYSCMDEDNTGVYAFRRENAEQVRIITLDPMFNSRGGVDRVGTGPILDVQFNRLTVGDGLRMKAFRQISIDYLATHRYMSPSLIIEYTSGLRRSEDDDIVWLSEGLRFPKLPHTGTNPGGPTATIRYPVALHDTAIGIHITEDLHAGHFETLDINSIGIAFYPMRENRVNIKNPGQGGQLSAGSVASRQLSLVVNPESPVEGQLFSATLIEGNPDAANPITAIAFDLVGNRDYLANGTNSTFESLAAGYGQRTVSAIVTYANGLQETVYKQVQVSVAPPPSLVTVLSDNNQPAENEQVTFTLSGLFSDGIVDYIRWYKNNIIDYNVTGNTFITSFTGGYNNVSVRVKYLDGRTQFGDLGVNVVSYPSTTIVSAPEYPDYNTSFTLSLQDALKESGQPTLVEWDLNEDGIFEVSTGATQSVTVPGKTGESYTFAARVSYSNGRVDNVYTIVNVQSQVFPAPTVTSSDPTPANNTDFTLTANNIEQAAGSPTLIEWDLDGNGSFETNTGTTPNVTVPGKAGGTYTMGVKLTYFDASVKTASVTVDVNYPAPTITSSPTFPANNTDFTLTANNTQQLAGNPTLVEWDLDGNGTYETNTGTTANVTVPGKNGGNHVFGVKLTYPDATTKTASVTVTVAYAAPTITSTPVSPDPNANFTLTANNIAQEAGSPTLIEWDLDGNGTYETNTGTTPNVTVPGKVGGTYTFGAKLTYPDASTKTASITVTVAYDAPTISSTPASPANNTDFTLTANNVEQAAGSPTLIEWDLDGNGSFETNTGTTANVTVPGKNGGTYIFGAKLTYSDASTKTASITVTVAYDAPTITSTPASPEDNTSFNLTLNNTEQLEGSPTLVEWDLDGNGTYETNTGTTANVTVPGKNGGTYIFGAKLTYSDASTKTASVTVTVAYAAPTITSTPASPEDNTSFTLTANNVEQAAGNPTGIEWDLDGNGTYETNTGTNPNVTVPGKNGGTYTMGVRLTYSDASVKTASVTVDVNYPAPTISSTPASPANNTDFTLTANNVEQAAGSPTLIEWDLDGNGSFETNTGTTANVTVPGKNGGNHVFGVKLTYPDATTKTASVTVTVAYAAPTITSTPASPSPNTSFTLTANNVEQAAGSPTLIEWDLDGNGSFETNTGTTANVTVPGKTAGSYNLGVKLTYPDATTKTASVTVTVAYPAPTITSTPASPEDNTSFTLTANNIAQAAGSPTLIEWDLDGNGTYETNTLTTPNVTVPGKPTAGNYTMGVKLTYPNTSTKTATITVTVQTFSPLSISDGGAVLASNNDFNLFLQNSAQAAGNPTVIEWDLDGNGTYETNTGTNTTVNVPGKPAGTYTIGARATYSDASIKTASITVTISDPVAVLTVTADKETPATGEQVRFEVNGVDTSKTVSNYEWEFNADGSFYSSFPNNYWFTQFYNAGNHTALCRVTYSDATTATASKTVQVPWPALGIYYPGANPNNDFYLYLNNTEQAAGYPTLIEWDLDDNATYETNTGTTDSVYVPGKPVGTYTIGVKATYSDASVKTASVTFTIAYADPYIMEPWQPTENTDFNLELANVEQVSGFPTLVEWDLDNDATYETSTGTSTTVTVPGKPVGTYTMGAKLTYPDASVKTASITFTVNYPKPYASYTPPVIVNQEEIYTVENTNQGPDLGSPTKVEFAFEWGQFGPEYLDNGTALSRAHTYSTTGYRDVFVRLTYLNSVTNQQEFKENYTGVDVEAA